MKVLLIIHINGFVLFRLVSSTRVHLRVSLQNLSVHPFPVVSNFDSSIVCLLVRCMIMPFSTLPWPKLPTNITLIVMLICKIFILALAFSIH